MRQLITALVIFCFIACGLATLAQEKAPGKLTFTAKNGNVTFDHVKHVERAKNDCKFCHDKLWPQSKTAPLNWKAGIHKPAETSKTSCGTCHNPGGMAFGVAGNCNKCHVKAG